MAHLYTALPSHYGERMLVTQLKALPDPQLHLWCGLNFIPGVKDTDLLIWHERCGVFNVEIKAVSRKMVQRFGWSHCEIEGRAPDRGPVVQAHEAMHSLRNFLLGRGLKLYLVSAAAWPAIRRAEWNASWDDPRVCGSYSESMLFHEDFYSDPAALFRRLEHIRQHPSSGGEKPWGSLKHDPGLLAKLRKELEVNARTRPTPSDIERLKSIESRVSAQERDRVPPRSGQQWRYTGKAGTGKTFRLLRVGAWHAAEGCHVLYFCFNKVLASDVKRLVNFSERLGLVEGSLDIFDAFDVLRRYLKEGFKWTSPDEDAEIIVSLMRDDAHTVKKYDTILIDEAQDLKQWAFEMALLHAAPGATILIASGEGQEMYAEEAPFLKEFRKQAKPYSCRTNFRNMELISRFAMLFQRANGDASQITVVSDRVLKGKPVELLLEFDRPGGSLPALKRIDETSLDMVPEKPIDSSHRRNAFMVEQYRELIESELGELTDNQRPLDLLILVPRENSPEAAWIRDALASASISFLDYSVDANRRSRACYGLCT